MLLLAAVAIVSCAVAPAAAMSVANSESKDFRPHFHFTPRRNWMNDPNGLVYHDGEYHMFFQYSPESLRWSNISWGHAVSKDLLHWEELDTAILYEGKNQIFSGSTVIDAENTAGFATSRDKPAMVAVYTNDYDRKIQSQALAYSNDAGRTFTKYEANPVLTLERDHFRDPQVFWHPPTRSWVMALALPYENEVWFYRSKDLKNWGEPVSKFGIGGDGRYEWECPVLFSVPLEGDPDPNRLKWVLLVSVAGGAPGGGSSTQYFIGDFDGTKFTQDATEVGKTRWMDWGKDWYAGQVFANAPDEKRIVLAWMNNWQYCREVPAMPFRSAMSLPRELTMRTIGGEPTLLQNPVNLDTLRGEPIAVADGLQVPPDQPARELVPGARGTSYEIEAVVNLGGATRFGIEVMTGGDQRTVIGFDTMLNGVLFVDRSESGNVEFSDHFPGRHHAALRPVDGKVRIRAFVDRSSVEVFGGQGEVTITDLIYPDLTKDAVRFFSKGGPVTFEQFRMYPIRSYRPPEEMEELRKLPGWIEEESAAAPPARPARWLGLAVLTIASFALTRS